MRFLHSFSTRPMEIQLYDTNTLKRLIGNVWYYALSVAYLKRLNQQIVLHTDELGKALLGFLPYDEIHTTLNEIDENYSPRFWAFGKMMTIEREPLNSIHIDGDVFIKQPEVIDKIENTSWDVVVQNREKFIHSERSDISVFRNDIEYCKKLGLDINETGCFNTGILGFRNEELKRTFVEGYKNLVLHFSKHYKVELHNGIYSTPDLVAEQQYIYQCVKNGNYNVFWFLDNYIEDFKQLSQEARNKGFQHVITSAKFLQLDNCKNTLKIISPEIYNNTFKLCRNI